jgi:hypothetical protein
MLLRAFFYLHRFGGWTGRGPGYHNDVWSFNLETSKWTELLYTGQPPSGRDKYAEAVVDDAIYIFGGGSDKVLGDLAIFKISSMTQANSLSKAIY